MNAPQFLFNLKTFLLVEVFRFTTDQLEDEPAAIRLIVARKLVGIGFILALLLATGLTAGAIWQVQEISGNASRQLVERGEMEKMEVAYSQLAEAEIALHGYRLSRDPVALVDYQTAVTAVAQAIRGLDATPNYRPAAEVVNIARLCALKLAGLENELVATKTVSPALAPRNNRPDNMGEIRAALREICNSRCQINAQCFAQIKTRAQKATGYIVATGLFACLLIGFAGRVLRCERQRRARPLPDSPGNREESDPVSRRTSRPEITP